MIIMNRLRMFLRAKLLFLFVLISIFLGFPTISSNAHPLPGGVNHNTYLRFDPENQIINMDYQLYMFFEDINTFYSNFDLDDNEVLSDDEIEYFRTLIVEKVYLEMDTTRLEIANVVNMTPETEVDNTIWSSVFFTLQYDATVLDLDQEIPFMIHNTYLVQSDDNQDWNLGFDQNNFSFEGDLFEPSIEYSGLFAPQGTGENSINSPQESNDNPESSFTRNSLFTRTSSTLERYLESESTQYITLGYLIILAFLFGVAHTFTPGHGKAIISSYMAAVHGTLKDAIIIATSMTLSHTGIVIALSVIFLVFREAVKISLPLVPFEITLPAIDLSAVLPFLPIVSGLAIMIIALVMLIKRVKNYADYRVHKALHEKGIDHHEHHEHHEHDHNHGHAHHHNHGHKHGHDHSHLPSHRLTLREGIWLGVTTGFNPCIDAVTLFILSLTLGASAIGVAILVSFSTGLALTLIVIGWIVGKGIRVGAGKMSRGEEFLQLLPIISTVFILITGLLLVV
jgi:nickel/cobalt exporter